MNYDPLYLSDKFTCPSCGRKINKGIYTDRAGILWCYCCKVFRIILKDNQIEEIKEIHDFIPSS